MIAHLNGIIDSIKNGTVVMDVSGVGFAVTVPVRPLGLPVAAGQKARIFTWLHSSEERLELFGFFTEDERELFLLLLAVKNIGPRMAMAMLSSVEAPELAHAILSGDLALLKKIPKVGPKIAERVIFELKDKGELIALAGIGKPRGGGGAEDVVAALVDLGLTGAEARKAVGKVLKKAGKKSMDSEELLARSLEILGRNE
ncbi:MAG: Holliday junction branch migration protein RuvA [Candidatus Eremiobacteraeota bacterium]|nr:Holliday junction branch migration protein RuvA [Candidatus Eremiobacteraeota bacterium]